MAAQDLQPRRALLASSLFLASALSSIAQGIPTEVRLCLQDYQMLARSGEERAGLDKLRDCAKRYPDVFALQKTLAKKLSEFHESSGDEAAAEEAIAAYQAAAKLDPAKFASLWSRLAALQQSLGRSGDAMSSWEQALPDLMISERQVAQDALWKLYRDVGEDEKALALWPDVSHRQSDDVDSVAAAARLHQDAARWDDAKDLWRRCLELRPDEPACQAAYNEVLAKTAASGGSMEKNALLAAWVPKLGEADDAFLGELMAMTREVLNPEAERSVAREMLRRDPSNTQANLSMGEALLSEGDEAGAEHALKKALAGGLSSTDEGRAHAVLGSLAERRTYARYSKAPSKTGKDVINATLRGYDRALSHYRKAAAAGADVKDAIRNVRAAKAALGGAASDVRGLETQAAKDACSRLSGEARFGYDRDTPIERTLKADAPLSSSAGTAGDSGNTLSGGSTVALMDARWREGTCWIKVTAADGRRGWMKKSKAR